MKRKYVLCTGVTGELGTALAPYLEKENILTACLIRREADRYRADLSNFKILMADLSDRASLFRYAPEMSGQVDTIIHMATAKPRHGKKELKSVILDGSLALYDFANKIGCLKYIYFSSIDAAGWTLRGMPDIDETRIPKERYLCDFGKIKLKAERELLRLAETRPTKVTILRAGNIYGPPTKLSFIKFVVNLLRKRKKIFYQRARHSVPWAPIYIDDVIRCIFLLFRQENFNNRIYFLTGSEKPTLEDLVRNIAPLIGCSGADMDLNMGEKAVFFAMKAKDFARHLLGRPSFPDFIYSNERMRREIGFIPSIRLCNGIPRTVRWALSKGML